MSALRRHKGAVQPPQFVWTEDYFTENEVTESADAYYNSFIDATMETAQGTAPDGTNTAIAVQCTAQAGVQTPYIQNAVETLTPDVACYSIYAKKDTLRYAWLTLANYGVGSYSRLFDADDGFAVEAGYTVGTVLAAGALAPGDTGHDYPDATGWYRIYIAVDISADKNGNVRVGVSEQDTLHRVTDPTTADRMLFWGPQINSGTFPTPYIEPTGSAVPETRVRTRSTTAWTRNAVVSRNYFAHSNDLLSWSGGSTYGAATNIIGPQRVKMFDISDAAPASWESITNLFEADYDGVSVVHCSWYVKKDAVAKTTRFPGWRLNFTTGYSATCDFRLDTSTGEVSVQTGAQNFDDYGAELVTTDGGDEYWHCWFDCTPASPGATNVYVVHYPAIGAGSNMAVYSSAAQGTVTSGGYRKDYLSAGAGEPLPYVGDTEGITTTPIGRYVPTNNVIYMYKGAVQPSKLALGGLSFLGDLVIDFTQDLVQDLVK